MKIINIVVGIGTTIILSSLIVLGIKAFHPEPVYPDYERFSKPYTYQGLNCAANDTACIAQRDKEAKEQQVQDEIFRAEQKKYDEAMKQYNRDVFLIANLIGILVYLGGFMIIFKTEMRNLGVPVGVMLSGLWGIFYGYMRGWGSADDQLKFLVGLVVAVLVIGSSMWLMNRYKRSHP